MCKGVLGGCTGEPGQVIGGLNQERIAALAGRPLTKSMMSSTVFAASAMTKAQRSATTRL